MNLIKNNIKTASQIYIIITYYYLIRRMIIPVKCFTCGTVLADKYRYYCEEVRKRKIAKGFENINKVIYLTTEYSEKTAEGVVLDEIGLFNQCCRRHMLTHVDIE